MEVIAHVVPLYNAASRDGLAGGKGIINNVLHCYQDGKCGMRAFSLPIVKVVLALTYLMY